MYYKLVLFMDRKRQFTFNIYKKIQILVNFCSFPIKVEPN